MCSIRISGIEHKDWGISKFDTLVKEQEIEIGSNIAINNIFRSQYSYKNSI